jgi:intein-encoded DNA endonuclease-like protein
MKTAKDRSYSMKHTQDRIQERYDFSINDTDYIKMCQLVESGTNIIFISKEEQKNDVQIIFDMFFKDNTIRVVWSKVNKCIKTVLAI